MKQLRLALFTGNYHHVADGVALTLNRWVRWLQETQGAEVLIIAPVIPDPPIQHAGRLIAVPSRPMPGRPEYRFTVGFPKSVRRELEAFKPNLVHVATPDYAGTGGSLWAWKRGIPVVSSYHTHFVSYTSYYKLGLIDPLLWAFMRWYYGKVSHVYVPSESMAEELLQKGVHANYKIWARGVETDRFTPAARDAAWRRSLGFDDSAPVVTFVSRLVWEKELRTVVDVFRRVAETQPASRFLIVGDGPARQELEALLPNAVFTGFLRGAELARAYASADIFFFPSVTETFGNVTLEALASGLPAIVADAPGSKNLVQHGVSGFIGKPRDVEAFASQISGLVADNNARAAMSARARLRAEEFSWPHIHETLLGYYNELLPDART